MGQHIRHDDAQTTDAGGRIYYAICECRSVGIPDKKIIEALIAELYGMSHLINNDPTLNIKESE